MTGELFVTMRIAYFRFRKENNTHIITRKVQFTNITFAMYESMLATPHSLLRELLIGVTFVGRFDLYT